MTTTDISFTGKDNKQIFAEKWTGKKEPKAILLIIHGSLEHSARYKHFGEFCVKNGINVYTMDLRGHGKSTESLEHYTILSQEINGWQFALDDIKTLHHKALEENPSTPLFILGHSMGTFLLREYISLEHERLNGVLLSGTGGGKQLLLFFGKIIARINILLRGRFVRNKMLHNLAYGTLNNQIENPRTPSDFISKDTAVVDAYLADPYCGGIATQDYIYQMSSCLSRIGKKSTYKSTPNELPIHLFSGEEDPVGCEKGDCTVLTDIVKQYKASGNQEVTLKLYKGARHETLNESIKEDVYKDVVEWIQAHLS